jgi:hypothetical protein
MPLDKQSPQDDDQVHFDLRLDRQTFRDLQAIAEKQRCGVGGVVRFYVKNAISQAKAKNDLRRGIALPVVGTWRRGGSSD